MQSGGLGACCSWWCRSRQRAGRRACLLHMLLECCWHAGSMRANVLIWHEHALSNVICSLPSAGRSCCRYEHALSKANYASLALRPESRAEEDEGAGLDEDEDLYQSLNKCEMLLLVFPARLAWLGTLDLAKSRGHGCMMPMRFSLLSFCTPTCPTRRARQLAQKTAETRGPENIAADLIKRREEQQKAQTAARLAGGGATDEGE